MKFPARELVINRIGRVKEHHRPNVVLLDLDLPRAWRRWRNGRPLPARVVRGVAPIQVIRAVCSIVGLHPLGVRYDRTRKGFHAVVYLPWRERLTPAETVALQACLGSDLRREALNLMRVRSIRQHGCHPAFRQHWNILFERKVVNS